MLLVYKSNRLENLAGALAEVLREPLPSALMSEWVGVQTQGVGVWLGMEISRRLGIWSNIYSPYPRAMIEKIFTLVLGDECPDTTLFEPERLTWSVMGLLPELIETPEFAPLASYLSGDRRGIKRYQLSCRIAETFDRYAVYRPDMVLAWEKGIADEEEKLSPENRWQSILWRGLVRRLGASHVTAAAKQCLEALGRSNDCPEGLPPRISLFGVSTLPPLYVNLLGGLPECVSVNLFMLSPSREHWAYIRGRREILRDLLKSGADADRLDDAPGMEEGNRLLASLGRLGRDFQGVLESGADYLEPGEDIYGEPGGARLLHMLQSDVLNLRLRSKSGDAEPLPVRVDDDSLGVHVCHSPMREVQVLFDQLLDVLQKNPDIHPHDVIVMMPDIDTYAPLIEAVFGSGTSEVRIPYTISDRGPAGESPVIQAFMTALHLAGSRLPVQEMLDLLSMAPVRERFGLSSEDVKTVRHWIWDAGVRWGLDAGHRVDAGQPAYSENTWSFGLSRLFLGIAMPDDFEALCLGTLPYPGIEGKAGELLGRAAEFFHTLFQLAADCRKPKSATEWVSLLLALLSGLICKDSENNYQHRMVRDSLENLSAGAKGTGFGEPIERDVVVQHLTEQFKQRPSVRGFLSGGVTFCNLLPMRSIPFKVVCLLGMNDADFPRSRLPCGFDLTTLKTKAGDRSVRNDDRYLFLEALLSAREKLLVFYMGRSVSDNSVLPPSVVLGELLDSLEEGFYANGCDGEGCGEKLRDLLTTQHPLQPFSPLYFDSETPGCFSYSGQYLAGARALAGSRREAPVLIQKALPQTEADAVVRLVDLIRFFRMPPEYLLRHRLGVDLRERALEMEDREPVSLDALARYGAGEFLLGKKLLGAASEDIYPILKSRGDFPIGAPGRCAFDDLDHEAGLLEEDIRGVFGEEEMLPPVSAEAVLGDFQVFGTIGDLTLKGRMTRTFGRLTEGRKIELWITHLFMNIVSGLPCPATSLIIGRGGKGAERCRFHVLPDAADRFRDLLAVYRLGMTLPLPLFPMASCAYARAFLDAGERPPEGKTMASIQRSFLSANPEHPGESGHPAVRRLFGTRNPLANSGEAGFAELAVRVFGPMLQAEGDDMP